MNGTMTRREALRSLSAMLGGAISLPVLSGVLGGCQAGSAGEAYELQTLTAEQNDLVGTLAEIILPETDTPGARAAGVPEFIDRMLTGWYPEEERTRFLAGLGQVDARAREAYGQAFGACTSEQQAELVVAMDRAAFPPLAAEPSDDAPEEDPVTQEGDVDTGRSRGALSASGATAVDGAPETAVGDTDQTPFYRMMKELTLVGYYTSEAGATKELAVMPMGPYRGDVPYTEIGQTWA